MLLACLGRKGRNHLNTISGLYGFARHRPEKNYYQILQVPTDASADQIKQNYLKMVKKYHPDVTVLGHQHIKKINQAYNILSNLEARRKYDQAKGISQQQAPSNQHYSQQNVSNQNYTNDFSNNQPRASMGRVLVTMFFMGMIITAAIEIIFGTQRQSRPPVQQMPPQNQYSSQNIPQRFQMKPRSGPQL